MRVDINDNVAVAVDVFGAEPLRPFGRVARKVNVVVFWDFVKARQSADVVSASRTEATGSAVGFRRNLSPEDAVIFFD